MTALVEDLIYNALKEIPYVSENAARYSNNPAVFYRQAPHDKEKGWEKGAMFPCIIYNIDWRYNAERKTDGAMAIEVYCNTESRAFPEDISMHIVQSLSELFLTDESGTYCLLWDRSDSFEIEGNEPLTTGVAISFDILAFPKQEGITPCPVWAANQFIKQMQPNCILIGHDEVPAYLRATALNPIIYVRKANAKNVRTTYAMAWLSEDIIISVISSTINETRQWINAILMDFRIEGETVMQNSSPYLIRGIRENTSDDPLKTGQIVLSGEYGVMRKDTDGIKLNNINFER